MTRSHRTILDGLRLAAWASSLGLSLGIGLLLFTHLRWGPWAFSDSVAYVDAARGLLHGRGLVVRESPTAWVPLAHFPPLYPLVLALGMRLTGGAWWTVGRVLDASMYAALLGLVAWVGLKALPQRPWWGPVLAFLLAMQPPLPRFMSGLMTEPPFLTLAVFVWAAVWAYGRTRDARWWWAASGAAALGLLLRYAGLFYLAVLPAALWVFPLPREERRRRFGQAWAVLLLTYTAWNLYMRIHGNGLRFAWPTWAEAVAKTKAFLLALPPVFWDEWLRWRQGLNLPGGMLWPWALVLLGALLLYGLSRFAHAHPGHPAAPPAQASALAWLFGHGYALFFLAAFMTRRPEPDFNPRVMLLWFVFGLLGLLLALATADAAWPLSRARLLRGLMYGTLLAGLLALGLHTRQQSRVFLRRMYDRGLGYTAREWRRPETWAFLRAWPEDIPWVTNAPEPLLLWADRPAYRLAEYQQAMSILGPLGYREAVDFRHKLFISGQAAAIYVRPEEERAKRLYQHRAGALADLLFRRYTRCYEDDLIELYYLGPRAAELCPLGPSRYHHPRR